MNTIYHVYEFPTTSTGASSTQLVQLHFGLDILEINSWKGQDIFIPKMSKLDLRPMQPPVQREWGILSLGVNQLGCEADSSSPSRAEVKKVWTYTSVPHIF
jgi:hypothetical protein